MNIFPNVEESQKKLRSGHNNEFRKDGWRRTMVKFVHSVFMKGICTSLCKASETLPISVQAASMQHVPQTTAIHVSSLK